MHLSNVWCCRVLWLYSHKKKFILKCCKYSSFTYDLLCLSAGLCYPLWLFVFTFQWLQFSLHRTKHVLAFFFFSPLFSLSVPVCKKWLSTPWSLLCEQLAEVIYLPIRLQAVLYDILRGKSFLRLGELMVTHDLYCPEFEKINWVKITKTSAFNWYTAVIA